MRSIVRLSLIALVLSLPAAAGAAPTLVRTLPNKITLITREVRTRPIACIEAWLRVGGRDETPQEHGLATILGQQLLAETEKHPQGELQQDILSVGGNLSSETGYGYTLFTITVPSRFVDRAVQDLAEALIHPRIDSYFLEQGKGKAQNAVRDVLSTPAGPSLNLVRATLWAGTPMSAPAAVPSIEISNASLTMLQRFYTQHYVAGNLTLVATGDVDSGELAGKLAAAFADMPQGPTSEVRPLQEKPFAGPKVIVQKDPSDTQGAAITIGFRGPVGGSADALAMDALLALLVDSPDSRFRQRLAAGANEFTGMDAARSFELEGGIFTVVLRVPPLKLVDAEDVLLGEIEKVKNTPITDQEFTSAIRTVEAKDLFPEAELLGLGRATAVSDMLGEVGGDEVYFDRLHAIRREDLTAVARKYMDLKQSVFVEMAPDSALKLTDALKDPERRVSEKMSIAGAAYKGGPSVPISSDDARRKRIDAPLARIPKAPLDSGRRFVQQARLPGGLRVITGEDRSAPLVTAAVYMLGGVRYENAKDNGITALSREALMNCDDPGHPGSTFRVSLSRLGRLVPYQDRDMWGYSISVPVWSFPEAIRTLGAMMAHAKVDSVTVDASRINLLTAYDKWKENDALQRQRLIFETKYVKSGYRLPALGNRLNLASIPQTEIHDFLDRFIVRPNVVVSVFGDIRPDSAKAAVADAFRRIPDGPFRPGPVVESVALADSEREKWELGEGPRSTVTLAFNGPRATSTEVPAFYVVNSLLSGPKGWFNKWVMTSGAVVSANSIVSQAIDECPIIAEVTTDGLTQEEPGVKLLMRQFKKVGLLPLRGPELADDFKNAKLNAVGTYLMLFTSNTTRAFQWSRAALFGLPEDYVLSMPAKLEAVTPDDLVSVGLRYFQKDNWNQRPYAICETRPGGW
jgi:zinc protease